MADTGQDQKQTGLSVAEGATDEDLTAPYAPERVLDPREKGALTYFRTSGAHPISADTAERMFFLFLRGLGTEDIRKLAPSWSLAQIVQARVAGEWDRRRAEYDTRLATQSVETAARARLELATYLGDSISIAAKIGQERLQRYALTRREEDLGGLDISTIKDLKNALELLLKTTGQDAPPKKDGAPPFSITGDGATVNVLSVDSGTSLADLAARKRGARRPE